jgi:hypothetical protein
MNFDLASNKECKSEQDNTETGPTVSEGILIIEVVCKFRRSKKQYKKKHQVACNSRMYTIIHCVIHF